MWNEVLCTSKFNPKILFRQMSSILDLSVERIWGFFSKKTDQIFLWVLVAASLQRQSLWARIFQRVSSWNSTKHQRRLIMRQFRWRIQSSRQLAAYTYSLAEDKGSSRDVGLKVVARESQMRFLIALSHDFMIWDYTEQTFSTSYWAPGTVMEKVADYRERRLQMLQGSKSVDALLTWEIYVRSSCLYWR